MKASELSPLFEQRVTHLVEVLPSEHHARAKLNSAYKTLLYAKDHVYNGLKRPLADPEWVNQIRVYVDPENPAALVYGPRPVANLLHSRKHVYAKVLSLAVGASCVINPRGSDLSSVHARLKQLAAEVEAELGQRPCWVARWADSVKTGHNPIVVTRLPDDYDPATEAPRVRPTGERFKSALGAMRETDKALEQYEYGALYNALVEGREEPPIPAELRALLAEHRPHELTRLEAEAQERAALRAAA